MQRLANFFQKNASATALISVLAVAGLVWGLVASRGPASSVTVQATTAPPETPTVEDGPVNGYELRLTKIDVKVPINLDVPGTDEKKYLKSLQTGVAHYAGTPKPGEQGNSFIFGHSSYLDGAKGDYNEVFKRLNEVAKDDTFTIKHENDVYTYKVFASAKIRDDDFSVLDQTDKEVVSIMTCWPPGTIAARWIIQAERVPDAVTAS
ncbi:sortase [Candidatus Berkelbacteria bacterium]|nr:sortase [Candidatus Berkelbacteria bacterium]